MTSWRVEDGVLHGGRWSVPCTIGRNGLCDAADKREGDGCTPRGIWPIRAALLRPDHGLVPPSGLPWRWLRPQDGWSDDPRDPAYNRPVRHPHPFSAEAMWRSDGLYDVVIVLGHNDHPPVPGDGSAIFFHMRGDAPTEGCVAIADADMRAILSRLAVGDSLAIR
ncbi:L,D-transpeptidase family protein [Sphingomonas abietis]|uniref:L,D-transpeptidase family protein n=1 Tax=Sphingomonas abietis TaxID=3012344 RepID=A0ABY7NM13_9SPHN|nr:L,D-transpeptidase family protein [Sphingomonas abietis]WBO22571.1 L,D-transpeptidase family protein [Sphingomonas abietis]